MTLDARFPDTETVAPNEEVLKLNPREREIRLHNLMSQAQDIVDAAVNEHLDEHQLMARVVLFSGGNDSTVLAHLMRYLGIATHAAHANTTIGVEQTREFVRSTCHEWGLPLLEKYPQKTYRELVIGYGFPGPGHHYKMYQQLKERCLRQVRKEFVTHPRRQRVLFVAGRRRSESARRSAFKASGKHAVPLHEREGSTIWASPIAMWTKLDMVAYRGLMQSYGNTVPFNPVTDHLGMSGECLCGSFAQEGELERIRLWYPDVAEEIDQLQQDVIDAGWQKPHCQWGHRSGGASRRVGKMCTSCVERAEE